MRGIILRCVASESSGQNERRPGVWDKSEGHQGLQRAARAARAVAFHNTYASLCLRSVLALFGTSQLEKSHLPRLSFLIVPQIAASLHWGAALVSRLRLHLRQFLDLAAAQQCVHLYIIHDHLEDHFSVRTIKRFSRCLRIDSEAKQDEVALERAVSKTTGH